MGKRAHEDSQEHWCQKAARVIERHVELECNINQAKNTVSFSAPKGTRLSQSALLALPENTKVVVQKERATIAVLKRAKRPEPCSTLAHYVIPPNFREHTAAIKENLEFAAEHVIPHREAPLTLVTQKAFHRLLVIVKIDDNSSVRIARERSLPFWLEYDGANWLFVQTHSL
jgi:hypothetical protein